MKSYPKTLKHLRSVSISQNENNYWKLDDVRGNFIFESGESGESIAITQFTFVNITKRKCLLKEFQFVFDVGDSTLKSQVFRLDKEEKERKIFNFPFSVFTKKLKMKILSNHGNITCTCVPSIHFYSNMFVNQ
ncbi:hypothetical protein TRFO_11112 [Tritrichomonas foetus]|uniref:SUN domain-containing protein n=1 Tax=Tritrichomonas foetus TaxID=1144522 RepID=A0A1J4J758_9EUKA|nr:hypothetical protein TRFO_11112 [Tritrichomonas foetus]|eukprot:OHS94489.1 hypothetical protein TRFO_11112 [Tritrichomonas foetus]